MFESRLALFLMGGRNLDYTRVSGFFCFVKMDFLGETGVYCLERKDGPIKGRSRQDWGNPAGSMKKSFCERLLASLQCKYIKKL